MCLAVWWYDYALNLDREIRYFWGLKWSLNKVLFFSYRYPLPMNTALTFLTTLTGSWQSHLVCLHIQFSLASLILN